MLAGFKRASQLARLAAMQRRVGSAAAHAPAHARACARAPQVGEVNIDNSLVVDNLLSKEDLVSMDKGCVCCSLRHDIVKALRELQRRAAARGGSYDAILLETTGLADPAPVAFTFFSNAWISANFRLDSIVCLVDAQHISKARGGARRGGAGGRRRRWAWGRWPRALGAHRTGQSSLLCYSAGDACCRCAALRLSLMPSAAPGGR